MRYVNQKNQGVAISDDRDQAFPVSNGRRIGIDRRRFRASLVALLIATPLLAGGQSTIDWWSIDGGGEIRSQGGDWTLSGTLGQPDGTQGNLLTGGSWQLTGGFWAVEAPAADGLFVDSFED